MGKKTNISQLLRKYNSYKITREELRRLLKSEPFGRVTGIIGPFVLRYKNDKLIISDRAIIFNASQSWKSVNNRSKFAAETRFASALNRIPLLKKIWARADVEGVNGYHKLIKNNQIPAGFPSVINCITPRYHSIYHEQMCSLDQDLSINFNKNAFLSANEQLVIVIIPFEPIYVSDRPFKIIHLCLSSIIPGSKILLNDEQLELCRKYKNYIMYSAIVKEDGKVPEWSNTVSCEGKIVISEEIAGVVIVMGYFALISGVFSGVQKQLWSLKNARDG